MTVGQLKEHLKGIPDNIKIIGKDVAYGFYDLSAVRLLGVELAEIEERNLRTDDPPVRARLNGNRKVLTQTASDTLVIY